MKIDNVRVPILDRSAGDFSGAANFAAAAADPTAQTAALDCQWGQFIDITVEITNVGTGPMTKIFLVGRVSSAANPDITAPAEWSALNTEAVDTATGISTIVAYQAEISAHSVGEYTISFPKIGRYFGAVVWVDAAPGTRGTVYAYRRGER